MQRNVLEYLEETVKRVPDKIAFANDKTQLTFQQFSDDIRAIGSELIRKGYQKEPVLIYMILSILVDTFISKISLTMQPGPKIDSISGA